jgi:transposase
MSLATAELPTDPAALRAFALACQDELRAAELAVQYKTLEIEKLKFQIAKLRRMQFGRSSERINHQIAQLELRLEELEAGEAEDGAKAEAANPAAPARAPSRRASRCQIICRVRRWSISPPTTAPAPVPHAGAA